MLPHKILRRKDLTNSKMTSIIDQTRPDRNACPKISIVVPAYNTEKFINRALDSLINQDYPEKNYEIIIIDDGSTDKTGKICDDYAEKFPFIHVTHTENYGPAHARNVALKQCQGEYITFCDSDDFVSPQLISILNLALKVYDNRDVIVWRAFMSRILPGWTIFPSDGWPVYDTVNIKAAEFWGQEEFSDRVVSDVKVQGFTWNKLYRRDIINGIEFSTEVRPFEDELWSLSIISHNENIKAHCIDYYLYCYCFAENENAELHNKNLSYHCDGISAVIRLSENILKIENLSEHSQKIIKGNIYDSALNTLFSVPVKMTDEARAKLRKYVKNYARDYFKQPLPASKKIKMLIKHILVTLHIHK